MASSALELIIDELRPLWEANSGGRGVRVEDGLSETEMADTEKKYSLAFPPDLRYFLGELLPVGGGFPDWRNGEPAELEDQLGRPLSGIEFDIEHNDVWLAEWGPRPAALPEALARVRELVAQAPRLIPVFGHRYLADRPLEEGNPVFSVWQTDIIPYGIDLADYLRREFRGTAANHNVPAVDELKEIEFWSPILRANNE